MSDIDALLAALDALHEAATDAPWRTECDPTSYPALYGPAHARSIASLEMVSDAALIVALRNAYPSLRAALRDRDETIRTVTLRYEGVLKERDAAQSRVAELERALGRLLKAVDQNEMAWDIDEAVEMYFSAKDGARAALTPPGKEE